MWVWLLTGKPPRKANGASTALRSSKEMIKQFVQPYRKSSLCCRKKHCDTPLCSPYVTGEAQTHARSKVRLVVATAEFVCLFVIALQYRQTRITTKHITDKRVSTDGQLRITLAAKEG